MIRITVHEAQVTLITRSVILEWNEVKRISVQCFTCWILKNVTSMYVYWSHLRHANCCRRYELQFGMTKISVSVFKWFYLKGQWYVAKHGCGPSHVVQPGSHCLQWNTFDHAQLLFSLFSIQATSVTKIFSGTAFGVTFEEIIGRTWLVPIPSTNVPLKIPPWWGE